MSSTAEAMEELVRETVRLVLEEATPTLVSKIVPTVIAEIRMANGEPNPVASNVSAYVPVRNAAAMMSAHPVTVRKLIADGKLGRYSVEGQLRVKLTDIHAYMAREGKPSPTIDLAAKAMELLRDRPPRR